MRGKNACTEMATCPVQLSIFSRYRSLARWLTSWLAGCLFCTAINCAAVEIAPVSLVNLSLEELGEVQVTSVTKKVQRLSDVAASIYVITDEAIQRSGAHSLPEVLRLAPNLLVAQITSNTYAISARGFNSSTANKLLVMIDGRTIYTPLYSGVFWDVQDVLLADVERIEVVSGPGGTLWGGNAVNGIINVISKRAAAKEGDLLQMAIGNSGRSIAMRHAGSLPQQQGNFRLYAKFDQGLHSSRANGSAQPDAWQHRQAGFRIDAQRARSEYTLQGDVYQGATEQVLPQRQRNSGANLLLRWTRMQEDGSGWRVQSYFDHTEREIPGTFRETLNTWDLDAQFSLPNVAGKQTIFGGGYRIAADKVRNSSTLAFLPAERNLHWANLFIQHERMLFPELKLTLGSKLESNVYTGVEFLPSSRLSWKSSDNQLFWLAFARAVRAPSRIDTDLFVPGKAPYRLAGGPAFQSEIANTAELGWQGRLGSNLSYSFALSHAKYNHLRSLLLRPDGVYELTNLIHGRQDSFEAWAKYQLGKDIALDGGLLLLHSSFSGPNLALSMPGNDPHRQLRMGLKWNLSRSQQFDVSMRHVGRLSAPAVPAYSVVDLRFAWQVTKNVDLKLKVDNLFNRRHQEFAAGSSNRSGSPIVFGRVLDLALSVMF